MIAERAGARRNDTKTDVRPRGNSQGLWLLADDRRRNHGEHGGGAGGRGVGVGDYDVIEAAVAKCNAGQSKVRPCGAGEICAAMTPLIEQRRRAAGRDGEKNIGADRNNLALRRQRDGGREHDG